MFAPLAIVQVLEVAPFTSAQKSDYLLITETLGRLLPLLGRLSPGLVTTRLAGVGGVQTLPGEYPQMCRFPVMVKKRLSRRCRYHPKSVASASLQGATEDDLDTSTTRANLRVAI